MRATWMELRTLARSPGTFIWVFFLPVLVTMAFIGVVGDKTNLSNVEIRIEIQDRSSSVRGGVWFYRALSTTPLMGLNPVVMDSSNALPTAAGVRMIFPEGFWDPRSPDAAKLWLYMSDSPAGLDRYLEDIIRGLLQGEFQKSYEIRDLPKFELVRQSPDTHSDNSRAVRWSLHAYFGVGMAMLIVFLTVLTGLSEDMIRRWQQGVFLGWRMLAGRWGALLTAYVFSRVFAAFTLSILSLFVLVTFLDFQPTLDPIRLGIAAGLLLLFTLTMASLMFGVALAFPSPATSSMSSYMIFAVLVVLSDTVVPLSIFPQPLEFAASLASPFTRAVQDMRTVLLLPNASLDYIRLGITGGMLFVVTIVAFTIGGRYAHRLMRMT